MQSLINQAITFTLIIVGLFGIFTIYTIIEMTKGYKKWEKERQEDRDLDRRMKEMIIKNNGNTNEESIRKIIREEMNKNK